MLVTLVFYYDSVMVIFYALLLLVAGVLYRYDRYNEIRTRRL